MGRSWGGLVSATFDLVYRDSIVRFRAHEGADVSAALAFLGTHFRVEEVDSSSNPLVTLDVRHLGEPVADDGTWEQIFVRKSASEFFTIPALRKTSGDVESVYCTKTSTRFDFNTSRGTVDVFVGGAGQLDLVELIRDLVLKDQENRGAAVLHGTAAERDGRAVLITGLKGAGKSTVLLELVEHHGYRVMSGDKTLAVRDADGQTVLAGWPDYPHLGYATIVKYPGLKDIAGLSDEFIPEPGFEFSPVGKFAVNPAGFRERFPSARRGLEAPAEVILFPGIGAAAETTFEAVTGPEEVLRRLRELDESPFTGKHAGWTSFIRSHREAHAVERDTMLNDLSAAAAWDVRGPGDVTEIPWLHAGAVHD